MYEPHTVRQKGSMDAPNDLAEASGYQGSLRQGDGGPLWLSEGPGTCSPSKRAWRYQ